MANGPEVPAQLSEATETTMYLYNFKEETWSFEWPRLPKSHPTSIQPCEVIWLGENLKMSSSKGMLPEMSRTLTSGLESNAIQMLQSVGILMSPLHWKHLEWAAALTDTIF